MADISTSGTKAQVTVPVLPVPAAWCSRHRGHPRVDSAAARDAVDGAVNGRPLLLVPELDGRTAAVGTRPTSRMPSIARAAAPPPAARTRPSGRWRGTDRAGLWVLAEPLTDGKPSAETETNARELRIVLEAVAELRRSRRLPEILRSVAEPGALADAATAWADNNESQKLAVLETVDVDARVVLVLEWARQLLAETQIDHQIRSDVAEGVEKNQREYLLRHNSSDRRSWARPMATVVSTTAPSGRAAAALAVRAFVGARFVVSTAADLRPRRAGSVLASPLSPTVGNITDDRSTSAVRGGVPTPTLRLDDVKAHRLIPRRASSAGACRVSHIHARRRGDGPSSASRPPGVGKTSSQIIAAPWPQFVASPWLHPRRARCAPPTHLRSAPIGRIVRPSRSGTSPSCCSRYRQALAGRMGRDPTAALLESRPGPEPHLPRPLLEIDLDLSRWCSRHPTWPTPSPALALPLDLLRLAGYPVTKGSRSQPPLPPLQRTALRRQWSSPPTAHPHRH